MAVLHGCMTFRVSHREMHEFFQREKINGSIHHYKAGKYRMEYVQAGDTTKPLVLFIHGSPGSLSAFLMYLGDSTLMEHAFLITADRPGFGHSNFGVAEPSIARQGEILKAILEKHHASRPIVLVGHSLGGPLIAKMAIDYPRLVDGLVIIAGSMDADLEPNETWFRAPLATPFLSWILPRSFRASNDELYQLKPQLKDLSREYDRITCPVAVVHGKKDMFVTFDNVAAIERMMPNARLRYFIVEDAGHFIPWQNEDLIVESILHVLREAQLPQP
jgi:pimeloyl-ACP methyl ester carboxylesterase